MPLLATLRKKFYSSVLTTMVAVQLLNLSIDAVDPFPHFEDLAINEIESCLELFIEIVLDHKDAIKETDDHDHAPCKTAGMVVLFPCTRPSHTFVNDNTVAKSQFFLKDLFSIKSPVLTIISPPPRFV